MTFTQQCVAALKAKGIDDCATVCSRSIRIINRLARASDQPHLYPFVAAAPRAIRWYSRVYFRANGPCSNFEYVLGLEHTMSRIVNGGEP